MSRRRDFLRHIPRGYAVVVDNGRGTVGYYRRPEDAILLGPLLADAMTGAKIRLSTSTGGRAKANSEIWTYRKIRQEVNDRRGRARCGNVDPTTIINAVAVQIAGDGASKQRLVAAQRRVRRAIEDLVKPGRTGNRNRLHWK